MQKTVEMDPVVKEITCSHSCIGYLRLLIPLLCSGKVGGESEKDGNGKINDSFVELFGFCNCGHPNRTCLM